MTPLFSRRQPGNPTAPAMCVPVVFRFPSGVPSMESFVLRIPFGYSIPRSPLNRAKEVTTDCVGEGTAWLYLS
jgi:hypothetical protein